MITRSFRTKIALLAITLAGVVMSIAGLYIVTLFDQVGLERVDRELRTLAESLVRGHHPRDFWAHFGQSLGVVYGDQPTQPLMIKVTSSDGDLLYQSANWAPGLDRLPVPGPVWGETVELPAPAGPRPPRHREDRPPALDGDDDRFRPPPPHPREPRPRTLRLREPWFATHADAGREWRVGLFGNRQITLMMGMSLDTLQAEGKRYRTGFLISAPLVILGLAGGGWLLAQRAISPVNAITRTVEGITASGLDQRISDRDTDTEFTHLIDVLNQMLERLESSFAQATRFSADAAHELKTPLTVLQGELDLALQKAADGSDEQELYHHLLEEVQRLKTIVRKLLLLARADTGRLSVQTRTVDFSRLLSESAEDTEAQADGITVDTTLPDGVTVQADPDLLGQIVQNLTSNALKYNRPSGRIYLLLEIVAGEARFTITNTGTPIPEADQPHIFDRFFRVDRSRSRVIEGQGLGLSLARELTRAQGGDLYLVSSRNGSTAFALELPLSTET